MKYGLLITSDTYVASNSLFENEPLQCQSSSTDFQFWFLKRLHENNVFTTDLFLHPLESFGFIKK